MPNDDWKPGIQDDPAFRYECLHPEHEPPTHICIPPGKVLNHECPACGKRMTIRAPYVTL